jgi:hypothetical protein
VQNGKRRVTRDVDPGALRRLLDDPPRATVAFVSGDGVELVPVRVCVRDGMHLFGVRGDAAAELDGREVVLIVDGGAYWFHLHGFSVRGEATAVASPGTAEGTGLCWYAVTPRRVLAWDYGTIREE